MRRILFANGTTALWASLKAFNCNNSYIAVPATICPSVICAILASGNRPYFVDIERSRLGIDPSSLAKILSEVKVVIAVHAMGIPCEIEKITEQCQKTGVKLIEDCCQAQGATIDGQAVGQFGDVAIYSFGTGKIIDVGGGGEAETLDNQFANDLVEVADSLGPVDEDAISDLGRFYKFFYNQLYPGKLKYYQECFTGLLKDIAPRLLGRYQNKLNDSLKKAHQNLPLNIEIRRKNAQHYSERLSHVEGIIDPGFPIGSVPWRYNIMVDFPLRQFILKSMLSQCRAVSSWSPDISEFITADSYKATALKNSKWMGDGILNFWVDEAIDISKIDDTCNIVRKIISSSSSGDTMIYIKR